jgi:hypothetical protein
MESGEKSCKTYGSVNGYRLYFEDIWKTEGFKKGQTRSHLSSYTIENGLAEIRTGDRAL